MRFFIFSFFFLSLAACRSGHFEEKTAEQKSVAAVFKANLESSNLLEKCSATENCFHIQVKLELSDATNQSLRNQPVQIHLEHPRLLQFQDLSLKTDSMGTLPFDFLLDGLIVDPDAIFHLKFELTTASFGKQIYVLSIQIPRKEGPALSLKNAASDFVPSMETTPFELSTTGLQISTLSSQSIDQQTIEYQLEADFQIEHSKTQRKLGKTEVKWTLIGDQGESFSGVALSGQDSDKPNSEAGKIQIPFSTRFHPYADEKNISFRISLEIPSYPDHPSTSFDFRLNFDPNPQQPLVSNSGEVGSLKALQPAMFRANELQARILSEQTKVVLTREGEFYLQPQIDLSGKLNLSRATFQGLHWKDLLNTKVEGKILILNREKKVLSEEVIQDLKTTSAAEWNFTAKSLWKDFSFESPDGFYLLALLQLPEFPQSERLRFLYEWPSGNYESLSLEAARKIAPRALVDLEHPLEPLPSSDTQISSDEGTDLQTFVNLLSSEPDQKKQIASAIADAAKTTSFDALVKQSRKIESLLSEVLTTAYRKHPEEIKIKSEVVDEYSKFQPFQIDLPPPEIGHFNNGASFIFYHFQTAIEARRKRDLMMEVTGLDSRFHHFRANLSSSETSHRSEKFILIREDSTKDKKVYLISDDDNLPKAKEEIIVRDLWNNLGKSKIREIRFNLN